MNRYTLSESRFVRDLNCEVQIYTHNKTGARVVVMPADDDNRAISIAFPTPVNNDKGIPHIIEHSVLCGSEKYPLKDPYMQLMKGSMYSFLNAMTYSDFTVYPVASTNEKDFKNLADVYLDAAFAPLLPRKKEIFLQEGRHYVISEDETRAEYYNGVVFNEMKGVQGSPDALLEEAVTASLFKGTPYAFESGGLPTAICDLSFEELTDFYHRHYTASNCFIFLYGKMDYEEMLAYMSDKYLDRYERGEVYRVPDIPADSFDSDVRAPYSSDGSKPENSCYYAYNFALHMPHTPLNVLTLRILDWILCSSQAAYVKDAMQKAGIGEDFYVLADYMVKCPWFGFVSAGCAEHDKERFTQVIDHTLAELVRNGISKERLNATLNKLEFSEKEDGAARRIKGVAYALQMIPKLLYDEDDPIGLLEYFDAIDRLKELAGTDYFEDFIRTYFLENPHKNVVTFYPDTEFSAREDRIIEEKCRVNVANEDFGKLVNDYRRLNEYRLSEDSPEDAARIPLLERSDLSSDPDFRPSRRVAMQGGELVWQERQTNSIAYLDWRFDLRRLDESLLPYYRIFTEVFGAVDTKSHGYAELSDLIDSYTGGLSHEFSVSESLLDGTVKPCLCWKTKFLYENAEKAFALNREILTETDFSDTAHIRDMLLRLKTGTERDLLESSHAAAVGIGMASFSRVSAWGYRMAGYAFYRFLCDLLDHFDERADEVVEKLTSINQALLDADAWSFYYIGEACFLDQARSVTEAFIALLGKQCDAKGCDVALTEKQRTALTAPSQVQYAALCGMLPKEALEKYGHWLVLEHLLDTDYLWQNVRVLGGAYGVFIKFTRSGAAYMVSFRDPQLDATIECFRAIPAYIRSLQMDERTFRQFVIGAMNTLQRPRSVYAKGMDQINRELMGITAEDEARVREQIITATPDDIKALTPYLESWLDGAVETVIGGEAKIQASAIPFDLVNNLL